jgi:hypothetical protein
MSKAVIHRQQYAGRRLPRCRVLRDRRGISASGGAARPTDDRGREDLRLPALACAESSALIVR